MPPPKGKTRVRKVPGVQKTAFARARERAQAKRPDYDEPVNLLMASEDFLGCGSAPEQLVIDLLIDEFRRHDRDGTRRPGDEWYAWLGTVGYEPNGLIFWIGLSTNAPPEILDGVGSVITAMGFSTARATAVPDGTDLEPVLYMGDDGIERLR